MCQDVTVACARCGAVWQDDCRIGAMEEIQVVAKQGQHRIVHEVAAISIPIALHAIGRLRSHARCAHVLESASEHMYIQTQIPQRTTLRVDTNVLEATTS
jgi:hypothetical protein